MATTDAVKELLKLRLDDDTCIMEGPPMSVEYEIATIHNPTNYADKSGYETGFKRETEAIAEMESLAHTGLYHAHTLYSFRSCAQAIPLVTDPNQPDKEDIYHKTFDVLRPEILKLKEILEYHETVIDVIRRNITTLVTQKVVPEALLMGLIKLIDILQMLDNLKDMKSSLQNDFSFYKRSFQYLKQQMQDQAESLQDEIQHLQLFLGNPMHPKALIFFNLRTAVQRVQGGDEVILDLLQLAVEQLDHQLYVLPEEKYRLLRVLPHLVLLLDHDGDDKGSGNIFRNKKLQKAGDVQRIFRRYPVVPVYGDMHITLLQVLQRAPHFKMDKMGELWGANPLSDVVEQYKLATHWQRARTDYDDYLGRFALLMNALDGEISRGVDGSELPLQWCKEASTVVREGMALLGRWTMLVIDQTSWKMTHPVDQAKAAALGCSPDAKGAEYARVVRFNYSGEELSVLVDFVTMIKSVYSNLKRAESKLAPALRRHVHTELQTLVQHSLLPMLHRADKKKKAVKGPLMQLRQLGADWMNGVEPFDDYKAGRKMQKACDFPNRATPPAATQLALMRTVTMSLFDERSDGMQGKGLFKNKELDSGEIATLKQFYENSRHYPYVLALAASLRALTDLSDLWYREFYLEVTKCVQFPIEMSLPWMLAEHVILNPSSLSNHMTENLLYAMDLYNDSADRALHVLHKTFLYDEVEAEVNLCFQQLIFLLADNAYGYFKGVAASTMLDKTYRQRMEAIRGAAYLHVDKRRYHIPVQQRHVRLLGRTVDLNQLVAENVNQKLHEDLEIIIRRFEASELSHVCELEVAIDVLALTHRLLNESVELDPFDHIFNAVNESVGATAFRGRIMIHVLRELVTDLLPNGCFNSTTQRFVRAPVALAGTASRVSNPNSHPRHFIFGSTCRQAYEMSHKLLRGFFGRNHFHALIRLMGYGELPLLLEELMSNMEEKLSEVLRAYVSAIKDGLPPTTHPKFMFRTGGCYGYFEGKLRPLLEYGDMKPQVFQTFREVGNTLAFLHVLDACMTMNDALTYVHTAPFLGLTPWDNEGPDDITKTPLGAGIATAVSSLEGTAAADDPLIKSFLPGASAVRELYNNSSRSPALAFMRTVLTRVNDMMDKTGCRKDWLGKPSANGVMDTERYHEFHRLFSALHFLFLMDEVMGPGQPVVPSTLYPDQARLVPDDEEFGDGFSWAGLTFIHLLGQMDKFEMMDFSYYMLSVAEHDALSLEDEKSVGMVDEQLKAASTRFVERASRQRAVNHHICSLLETALPQKKKKQLRFAPPADDRNLDAAVAINSSRSAQSKNGVAPISLSSKKATGPSAPPVPPPADPEAVVDKKEPSGLPPPPPPPPM